METIKKREGLIFEYTDYGFTPLPSFSNQEFALSEKEIMQLLSMVLTVKLNEIYNYLKFLEPIELTLDAGDVTEAVIVQYEVPKLTWKAWF